MRWGRPVRRVQAREGVAAPPAGTGAWPVAIPAVRRLLADGLDLGAATVLVGENGSGKSTVVEAVAAAFGLNPEGGTPHARFSSRASESPLHRDLHVVREAGGANWGFFLRAETMHGLYTYLEGTGQSGLGPGSPALHEVSHGESFWEILQHRFDSPGFYVLDEPESALSFDGQLALVGLLGDLAASGTSQVLVATHSPIVAALPGARLLELDPDPHGPGWSERAWEDLTLVNHHRAFLRDPQRYLRHLGD
jgi:predicted ATPase